MAPLSCIVCLTVGLAALPGVLGLAIVQDTNEDDGLAGDRPLFHHRRERKHERARKSGVVERTRALRILFTSVGGVGTAGLMWELSEVTPPISTNDVYDWDGFKHKPYSRLIQSNAFKAKAFDKIIYVHGNLTRFVMSLDRKGWFLKHAAKTRSDALPRGEPHEPVPTNLQEYANDTQEDFFQFEKHFDSFYTQSDMPIAFLRISEVMNHIEQMADFLETSRDEVQRVLEPLQNSTSRKTNETQQEFEEREILEELSKEVALDGEEEFKPTSDVTPSDHGTFEVTQDVSDKLRKKLLSLTLKYNSLPGFKVIMPGNSLAHA